MKYLSKQNIQLNGKLVYNYTYDCTKDAKENNWKDCPIVSLSTKSELKHFKIKLINNSVLNVSNFSSCEVRKIIKCYFKDCYAIIELDRQRLVTVVYIANNYNVLNYYLENRILSPEEIDALLSNEKITEISAKNIKTFNIRNARQNCQSFFENLPTQCYLSDEYLKEIVQKIRDKEIPMVIENVADTQFVNIDACRKFNLNVFKEHLNKARKEKVGLNIK
ncbi:MAG: hypothetical protein IKM43_02905 [Clostridia bacterium]|nr:hypothetical protein [Clostridia bacterium]